MLVEALRERCCADNTSLAAARTRQEAGAAQWRLATGGAAERVETRSGFFFSKWAEQQRGEQPGRQRDGACKIHACLPVCQCASWPPRAALGIAVGCGRVKVERSQRVCGCVGVALSQLLLLLSRLTIHLRPARRPSCLAPLSAHLLRQSTGALAADAG